MGKGDPEILYVPRVTILQGERGLRKNIKHAKQSVIGLSEDIKAAKDFLKNHKIYSL